MNQYRCETCEKYTETPYLSFCDGLAFRDNLDSVDKEYIKEWIERVGCASHSDFQSERDKVLDEFLHSLDIRCDYIHDIKLSSSEIYKMANGLREKVKK